MRVAIAGAHGNIALRLTTRLAARGDAVTGLIRNPDHAEDVRAAGADPVVCDLEHATVPEIAAAIASTEAVVFAAGAGPGAAASASSRSTATGRSSCSEPPPKPGPAAT